MPASALTLNDHGDLGVRTVNSDNVVDFVPVSLLRDTADGAWITGLPDQADLIVVGQEYVVEGVQVDPTFRDGPTQEVSQ